MKREAKWQTIWSKYCQDQLLKGEHFNYELKQTQSNSFRFDSFEPQQIPSLLAAQKIGYHVKHSDADIRLKGFDGSIVPPQRSFVVIKYSKAFVMIGVNTFIHYRDKSIKKSLSYEQAVAIAHKIIHI